MKRIFLSLLVLLPCVALSAKYQSCESPQYKMHVEKRLAFFEQLEKQRYEEALNQLKEKPFESWDRQDQEIFLSVNTVLLAKFGSKELALKNIDRFEQSEKVNMQLAFSVESGDMPHLINIARGWIALKDGNDEAAIEYLYASTKTKGSPVLNSFGPDLTLIRALYQKGYGSAVLKYLELSELFWDHKLSEEYTSAWRKLIDKNCAIQFHFYDTTFVKTLAP